VTEREGIEGIDLGGFTPPVVPEAQPTGFLRRRKKVAAELTRYRPLLLIVVGTAVVVMVALLVGGGGAGRDSVPGVPGAPGAQSSPTVTASAGSARPTATEAGEYVEPAYDDQYGTFEPFTVSGDSSQIVQLPFPLRSYLLTASYSGKSLLSLSPLDASGNQTDEIGPLAYKSYEGTRSFGVRRAPVDVTAFDVHMSRTGSWTLTFAPVASAPVLALPMSGDGDAVFRYEGPAITLTFTHGDASFIAQTAGEEYINVGRLDASTSTVTLRAGRSVVEIYSGGDPWSLIAD
jgi:hypothetical protein